MLFDIRREIIEISPRIREIRRNIHAHPELGFQEFRTAQLVEDFLKEAGLRVRRCAGTGVIGVLEGGRPGKTVMLRAELDALPIQEENGLSFRSRNPGVMHACGHDCNTAVQLGAARILADHRAELAGSVVFLFQPNEEDCGAPQMIEDGALSDPRPDAIFSPHVWSLIPTGRIGVVPGPQCASSYYFKVTIHGEDCAGYAPWQGVNPIDCARHVLNAVDTMQAMECNVLEEPTLITVGMIHGGSYMINIPSTLEIQGSIRCLHSGEARVHARFRELVETVCRACRCTCDIEITCGNHLLSNDPSLHDAVCASARETLGTDCVVTEGVREMGGDDLAEFFRAGVPGCYYLVGMGNPDKGSTAPHHSRSFLADEDAMDIAVELQIRNVLRFLERRQAEKGEP